MIAVYAHSNYQNSAFITRRVAWRLFLDGTLQVNLSGKGYQRVPRSNTIRHRDGISTRIQLVNEVQS